MTEQEPLTRNDALPQQGALVVMVGNPNTGKTTLINALAGSNLKVGNWPGTTVDRLAARLRLAGKEIELVDLPGTYGLIPTTPEEGLVARELLNNRPQTIINVVDAGNLERNLHLTLNLSEMGMPMLVALNLMDEAEAKGYSLDPQALERELGVPVAPLVASRDKGVTALLERLQQGVVPRPQVKYPPPIEKAVGELAQQIDHPSRRWLALALLSGEEVPLQLPEQVLQSAARLSKSLQDSGIDAYLEIENARFARAHELARAVITGSEKRLTLTDRIDKWVLHPLLGGPLFLLGMLLAFRFTFSFSSPWVDFIGALQEVLAGWVHAAHLPALLSSFLADGLIGGVGTVISFAPVLFFLYLALAFLETSGFLARAAFIADKFMLLAGLPGRAFIPLILGFGCNVPAVYSTRILNGRLDRLRVAMAVPFMTCSARLVVFTLFAAVFFPKQATWVVFGLYLLGMLIGLLTAWALGRAAGGGSSSGLMELPPYRMPTLRVVVKLAWARTRSFLQGAGGPILLAVLFVWMLLNLPPGASLQNSYYARAAELMQPLFAALGIHDWRLLGALIPGFVAKEVVVGTLAVSYLGSAPGAALGFVAGLAQIASALWQALLGSLDAIPALLGLPHMASAPAAGGDLRSALAGSLTQAGALSYLAFLLLYTPCVATLAAIKNEFGKFWAAFAMIYELLVAFGVAWGVYRLALLLGGG